MSRNRGFTMIELLVVMIIIGILAAVAAPLYLAHTEKAKVSEAVGVISLIRQAEREYFTTHGTYLAVSEGNIEAAAPTGLDVKTGPSQYFSKKAFKVEVGNTSFGTGINEQGVDFMITATGASSENLTSDTTSGARNPGDVSAYVVKMDNSGLTAYTTGGNYKKY